jgi:hypothetical protein
MGRRLSITVTVLVIILVIGAALGCGGGPSIASLDAADGAPCGHQNVTITGTSFEGATAVDFGGTPALSFTVADATHIVAVTPSGAYAQQVDVTVTTPDGAATLSDSYTYWAYDLQVIRGSTIKTYTLADIRAMQSATGFWGAVNDKPYDTDQYRGVPILTLFEAVGGVSDGEEIVARSSDGFTAVYTPEMLAQMVGGTFPLWNVNGTEVITNDRFAQLLLAYDIDTVNDGSSWSPLKAGKAPFRLVTATAEDGRMSQGPANPALVVSLEVRAATAATPAAGAPAEGASVTTDAAESAGGQGAGANALSIASLETTNGPRCGYQNVTISGSGFDEATGVTFGSNPAMSFTVADAGHIVAISPVGPLGQKVDVTVTTAGGAATLPGAYTYWDYDFMVVKGSKTVTYTLDDLKAMPPVTGFWGAHKDPVPHDTDQFRGVSLLELLKAVGGWSPGESIVVTSADGFSITYTTELLQQMADGTYPMWDSRGTEIVTDDRFAQVIVAYEFDPQGGGSQGGGSQGVSTSWQLFEPGTGPLRMALVTTESDRVNQGKFNPFLAVKAEVTAP